MNKTKKVLNKDMKTKCGWTPFNGLKLTGWPVGTIINGKAAFWNNKINKSVFGNPISFNQLRAINEVFLKFLLP